MKKSNFSPQAIGHFVEKLDIGDMLLGLDTGDPPAGRKSNLDALNLGAAAGH